MSLEKRDVVRPSTWLALMGLSALGLTIGGMIVGSLRDPRPMTLQEMPDRFVDLLLAEPEPERIVTVPAIGAPAPTADGEYVRKDAMKAARGAADAQAKREEVLQSSKLLAGLVGTRGERDASIGDMASGTSGSGSGVGNGPGTSTRAGEGGRREEGRVGRGGDAEQPPPALRQWFPETFLWAPEVVTDEDGMAVLEVTVPDRLGTWRVLGLSAAADGSTSGDVLQFDSRMDRYVEPVIPERLFQGDRVTLPVRVANRGSDRAETWVHVVGGGAVSGEVEAAQALAPGSAAVTPVRLLAERPGTARLGAELRGEDRVLRTFPVEPRGERGQQVHTGLLTGRSAVDLALPDDVGFARVTLTLQPGPAGLVRQELAAGARGDRAADLALAVALGASGADLLDALGAPATPAEARALRDLRLSAQQRLLRANPKRDPVDLALTVLALGQVQDDPLVDEVLPILRASLRQAQRSDGSWAVPDGAPLQQLLATTALCTLALDEPQARVRAGAVFERHAPNPLGRQRDDPFTAGLALAAGIPRGRSEARMRDDLALGLAAAVADPDSLAGLRRPDGSAMALADVALAATLAGASGTHADAVFDAWTPSAGFGDGLRGLLVLRGLTQLARADARPSSPDTVGFVAPAVAPVVSLRTTGDETAGVELAQDPSGVAAAVTLDLPADAVQTLLVEADDPAPVRWHLVVEHWRPWRERPHSAGLQVALDAPALAVGRKTPLALTVDGPGSKPVHVTVDLPAGVRLLSDEVTGATVEHADDRQVRLRIDAARAARREVVLPVVPTLSGELWRGAVQAWLPGEEQQPVVSPPARWTIQPG